MTREELVSRYFCEYCRCFNDLLRNIEISKYSLNGTEQWLYDRPVYMTIMSLNAKISIDEENIDNRIYCTVLSKDDYYSTSRRRYIYVQYKNKTYVIKPDAGDWDMTTGNLTLWCDVYEYDNELFSFSYDSIELYHKGNHPNKKELYNNNKKRSYQVTLNNNTNIIYEVIKRIKEEERRRTNKR